MFDITCLQECPVKDTGANPFGDKTHIQQSGFLAKSAFRVVSDVPVTVYQWNNYGKQMNTADASLLLPVTALDKKYIAATWNWGHEVEGEGEGWDRGEVTVVAVEDGTQISFTPSTGVLGGKNDMPAAMTQGNQSGPYSLNAFDVIQIAPDALHADLSGTKIEANKPIAVFGTHPCANAPSQPWFSCDHVE